MSEDFYKLIRNFPSCQFGSMRALDFVTTNDLSWPIGFKKQNTSGPLVLLVHVAVVDVVDGLSGHQVEDAAVCQTGSPPPRG